MKARFTLIMLIIAHISSADTLRVLSYNILNGYDYGKDTVRQANAIDFVKSQNADVVALQELCGFNQEKLEKLAQKWGHAYAVIVKEEGYPVGITSNKPIELKKKMREGLWHGMLHVKTHDIDFLVVHLSPFDFQFRRNEAKIITEYMANEIDDKGKFLVLGDFNALSPFDGFLNNSRPALLESYRNGDAKSKYSNLMDGEYDYSVMSIFLSYPLIDLAAKYVLPRDRFSYPTPILIGSWREVGEIIPSRCRIDYILSSRNLAQKCSNIEIINKGVVDSLSDHFPVLATFHP